MSKTGVRHGALLLSAALVLSGCEDGKGPNFDFLKKKPAAETAASDESGLGSTVAGERDVEAPDVFQAVDDGLWDGRPSLGGVWVAYPGIKDPERVIIRNTTNDKFVIGALFRRERDNPGPKVQVSSDAAEALGMLAGQPTKLDVVALRKEQIPVEPITTPDPATDLGTEGSLPDTGEIETATLDPVSAASAAIDRATPEAAPVPAPAPKPAAPQQASNLAKPFIQIGIFSVKANADNTATSLRGVGVIPTVKKQTSQGKTFYRVIVGPAGTSGERAALLKKVKGLGFNDAYFVTN